MDAKEFDTLGDSPVGKRRLFKVTDVVFVKGHPVVADKDFAAGIGVRGVDVILERRCE
jgi:hypothetical protein